MDFVVLGSGGAMPTPRPFCQCKVCKKARKGIWKRNHSAAFLTGVNFLFDCGEDIKESLNRENVKIVDAIFLSHWHPDHSFGLREVAEAYYDYLQKKPKKTISIYLSKRVFGQLKKNFPAISYYVKKGLVRLKFLEHGQAVKAKSATITVVGFSGKNSDTFGFLIETKKKRLFYAPCDTIKLREKFIPKNLDVLAHEMGVLSYKLVKTEISFPALVKRLKLLKPKLTVLTHVEEIELQKFGEQRFIGLEEKYKLNLRIAFDGMRISL